ncbi:hypothetical protein JGUZn3_08230 [Entomobacter blattae]|uniref:Uncharacterized protein n=1 Tax=Entomobacter blattae TaxID=2762277 RepID=A0A7H1NQJ6_9PROT|nr:hypothetical protein JGUZn3_08230 [Entomobacter blattae]
MVVNPAKSLLKQGMGFTLWPYLRGVTLSGLSAILAVNLPLTIAEKWPPRSVLHVFMRTVIFCHKK